MKTNAIIKVNINSNLIYIKEEAYILYASSFIISLIITGLTDTLTI